MKVVAVLESMWDWRQMTSGAGYKEAPRSFRINPDNYSGKRLYRIVGDADLLVTNACRELCGSANHHGTPDPTWLRENLELLVPFDVLLVCGKIAQATYARTGCEFERKIDIMHPAARTWTNELIDATSERVKQLDNCPRHRHANPRISYEPGEEEVWDVLTRGHIPSCECGACTT